LRCQVARTNTQRRREKSGGRKYTRGEGNDLYKIEGGTISKESSGELLSKEMVGEATVEHAPLLHEEVAVQRQKGFV